MPEVSKEQIFDSAGFFSQKTNMADKVNKFGVWLYKWLYCSGTVDIC